jgi:hypothetical protein
MGSLYRPNRGIIYQRRGWDLASLSRTQPRRGPTGLFLRWSFQLVPMSTLLRITDSTRASRHVRKVPKGDLTETAAAASRGLVSWRAGLPAMQETAQLGRPRRNSMIAALTSAGRSCWVQWPQPASIWMSRRNGTCCFMLAICSVAPGNATTRS